MINSKIQLPEHERGRRPNDIRRLDRLLSRLKRPDLTDKQRQIAMSELCRLENAPRDIADKDWREQAAAETLALAERRGETVEVKPRAPLRIIDRDPVEFLLRRGHLTADQYDAAVAMRGAYETRSEGIVSHIAAISSLGGGHNNDRFVFAGLQRAKRLQRLGAVERGVLVGVCRNVFGSVVTLESQAQFKVQGVEPHVGLQMLRAVCGEGKPLSSYGKGRAFERHLKALKLALDVAAEVLGAITRRPSGADGAA